MLVKINFNTKLSLFFALISVWFGYGVGYIGVAHDHLYLLLLLFFAWQANNGITPLERIALMLGFFLGSTQGVPSAIEIYNEVSKDNAMLGYIAQAGALTLPFVLFSRFKWGIVAGCLLLLVSPIGWVNPLILSGTLFPATGFVGIMMLIALAIKNDYRLWGVFLAVSVVMNINYHKQEIDKSEVNNSSNTVFYNTLYRKPIHLMTDLDLLDRGDDSIVLISSLSDKTIIFPETHFIESDPLNLLIPFLIGSSLEDHNKIIGGVFELQANENKIMVIDNGKVLLLDIQANALVPSPDNVFKNIGPTWNLRAKPATFEGNLIIVCFEEYHLGLLLWKMLNVSNNIDQIIGLENLWWSNQGKNSMVTVQHAYAKSFSRLFGLPYFSVANY